MSEEVAFIPEDNAPVEHAALFRAIAEGERYPLAKLYDEFSRPLFGLALRLLRDKAEAEDVLHDVFVSLRERAADFDPTKGSALTWLATMTRHRALDRLRTRLRRSEIVAQAAPSDFGWEPAPQSPSPTEGAEAAPPSAIAPGPSPAAAFESSERAAVIRQAITELPEEQRHALELAFFTGLTQQEVAEKLQEPLGTIKARIRRGLLQLREVVGKRL
jgi:RNA polymerase sigma-70 factor, ECF subfamily